MGTSSTGEYLEERDPLDDMHVSPEVEAKLKAWALLSMCSRHLSPERWERMKECYYPGDERNFEQIVGPYRSSWEALQKDR